MQNLYVDEELLESNSNFCEANYLNREVKFKERLSERLGIEPNQHICILLLYTESRKTATFDTFLIILLHKDTLRFHFV